MTPTPQALEGHHPEDPNRIVPLLPERSYLEERCTPASFAGLAAKRCRYRRSGHTHEVTLATIPRETLAAWIVDAAGLAAPSGSAGDPGLAAERLARYVVGQSSAAIPLDGDVWEDMAGDGVGKTYRFDRGVSVSSGTCRPMSLTRREWCAYDVAETGASRETCLADLESPEAWSALCASWIRDGLLRGSHPGLRAKARALAASPRSAP